MIDTSPTDIPIGKTKPDLTPRPLAHPKTIEADVVIAKVWLEHVATDLDDARGDGARRLLSVDEQTGMSRLNAIADLAHRTASQPPGVPLEEIEEFRSAMWELVYGYSEASGPHASPLYFLEPTALLGVLEYTLIWHSLATEPLTAFSTRDLARLARVETEVMEQQLDFDRIMYQPYGVSLREMEEMPVAEQLYFYDQLFVFGLKDSIGWLSKFPGFTSPETVTTEKPA